MPIHEKKLLFSAEKKDWKRQFLQELKRCLCDTDRLAQAVNNRESIKIANPVTNQLDAKTLPQALQAIDQGDSSIYSIKDPARLGACLRSVGFTEKEIQSMKLSTQLRYEAAIFSARGTLTYGGPVFKAYLDLYESEPDQIEKNQLDQTQFETELVQSAKPLIEQQELIAQIKEFAQKQDGSACTSLFTATLYYLVNLLDPTQERDREIMGNTSTLLHHIEQKGIEAVMQFEKSCQKTFQKSTPEKLMLAVKLISVTAVGFVMGMCIGAIIGAAAGGWGAIPGALTGALIGAANASIYCAGGLSAIYHLDKAARYFMFKKPETEALAKKVSVNAKQCLAHHVNIH